MQEATLSKKQNDAMSLLLFVTCLIPTSTSNMLGSGLLGEGGGGREGGEGEGFRILCA